MSTSATVAQASRKAMAGSSVLRVVSAASGRAPCFGPAAIASFGRLANIRRRKLE
ncbi:MAG: hypothetical protein LWX52_04650 [Deltaproteobacteria bacterium]|nr:hypothetical protein [Deltaproteobacteria bacterium]